VKNRLFREIGPWIETLKENTLTHTKLQAQFGDLLK